MYVHVCMYVYVCTSMCVCMCVCMNTVVACLVYATKLFVVNTDC